MSSLKGTPSAQRPRSSFSNIIQITLRDVGFGGGMMKKYKPPPKKAQGRSLKPSLAATVEALPQSTEHPQGYPWLTRIFKPSLRPGLIMRGYTRARFSFIGTENA